MTGFDSNPAIAHVPNLVETDSPIGKVIAAAVQRSTGRVPAHGFRRLGAFAFVLVLAGEGQYQDEFGTDTSVSTGDLITILPATAHAYGPGSNQSWVERYVVFEGPTFTMWQESGLLDPRHPITHLGDVDAWNTRIDHIFGESGRIGTLPALEVVCRLQVFLARAREAGKLGSELSAEDQAWLSAARALLGARSSARDARLDLHEIADSLSMSYDGFRKRFRHLTGMPPGQYRALRQIERARAMIQTGSLSDSEIAEALDFHDASHFSRRFKQIVGRSPQAFRAALPISQRSG